MKFALLGATGTIGQRILKEALQRGHEVTVVVRDASRISQKHDHLIVTTGDIFNPDNIAKAVAGHDVVLSAYGPQAGSEQALIEATNSLIKGVKQAGVSRLIAIGGAGSLEVASGLLLKDTPEFPDFIKPIANAHHQALEVYLKETELDWTVLSPAALIEPGERTGQFRLGKDQLVVNESGESRISAEDYAIAMLDEAQKQQHSRARFTLAY